jgi:hypothetical protein
MAFNIGAITGELVLNIGDWESKIKKATESTRSLEGAVINNSAQILKMGLALAAVGGAIVALDVKMLKMAADTQLTGTLFSASFGGMSDSAKVWSDNLSKAFTLNASDTMKALAQLNNMAKGLGVADDSAYQMSKSLTVLSLQMSRFFGITQGDAAGRLQMALAGMTRSLRELGIVIKEQEINQYALTHGIIKHGEALSMSQRALVVYSLLVQKTKFLQDAMGASSQNLTSLWNIFTGQVTELGETLGAVLIPVATAFLKVATKLVLWVIDIATRFPAATTAIVAGGAALGLLASGAGAALLVLPGLAVAAAGLGVTMGTLLGGTALAIGGVTAAVTALVFAIQNVDFLKEVFFRFAQGVNQAFADIQNALANFFKQAAKISPVLKEQFETLALSYQASAAQFTRDANKMSGVADAAYATQIKKEEDLGTIRIIKAGEGKKALTDMWQGAIDAAKNASDILGRGDWLDQLQRQIASFGAFGQKIHGLLADSIGNTFYDLTMGLSSLQEAAASFGRNILKMLFEIAAQWIATKIVMGMGFSSVAGGVASAGSMTTTIPAVTMGSSIPSFDSGTSNVPYDMIAKIHKGERVVPAGENFGGQVIELTIHNAITTEVVAMAMQSREGAGVIVNTINIDSLRNGVTRREVVKR